VALALLCLTLVASGVVTAPASAATQASVPGISGPGSYESPSYGYTVRWVDLWMPVPDASGSNRGLDVLTFDLMAMPARVQIFGLPPGGAPEDALNVAAGAVQKQFPAATVADQTGGSVPTMTLEYDYAGVPARHFLEARELESGASVVVVSLLAPIDAFEDRLDNAQVGIRLDGKPLFDSVESSGINDPTPTPKPRTPEKPKRDEPKTTPRAGTDDLWSLLPTEEEVPADLVLEEDAERKLDQMTYQLAPAFASEADAEQQLDQWGWQQTVDRRFTPAEGDALDNGIERLWVVVYQFDGANSAEEAMAAFVKAIRAAGAAKGVRVADIGDESVGLMDGSHVVDVFNLWTRADGYVIWVGGTTSGSFPRDIVEDWGQSVVAKIEAGGSPVVQDRPAGAVYESPQYGYRLTYDPAAWKILQEDQTPDDAYDQVLLTNDDSLVYLVGDPDFQADEMPDCVDAYREGLRQQDEVDGMRAVRGGSGEEANRAWATVSYQFTGDDGKTLDMVRYTECRALGDGVTLVVLHTALDESYDNQVQAREDLLATVERAGGEG
jgi:hypothetical protein